MNMYQCILFSTLVVAAFCQRSPYAGQRPVGYPALEPITTTADPLGNRFSGSSASTEPLPIEALGDRELVNRFAKLPLDKQPFWYINWRALEEQRKNHQTYEQRPNPFLDFNQAPLVQPQTQPGQNQIQNQAQLVQPQPEQNQVQSQAQLVQPQPQPEQNQIQSQAQVQSNTRRGRNTQFDQNVRGGQRF